METAFLILSRSCRFFAQSCLRLRFCALEGGTRSTLVQEGRRDAERNKKQSVPRSGRDRDEAVIGGAHSGGCGQGGRTLDCDTRTVPLLPDGAYALLSRFV